MTTDKEREQQLIVDPLNLNEARYQGQYGPLERAFMGSLVRDLCLTCRISEERERKLTEALEVARHELAILHGCIATDGPGGWTLDMTDVLAKIDAVLPAKEGTG